MTRFRILVMSALSLGGVAWVRPIYPVIVTGSSMSPTYHNLQMETAAAVSRPLQRGDVVILDHDGETLIKRVAFLGGDSFIQLKDGRGAWFTPCVGGSLKVLEKNHFPIRRITVPDGMVYVVGDNFAVSVDSNSFGPVPETSVIGLLSNQVRPRCGPTFIAAHYLGAKGWAENFFTRGTKP